MTARERDNSVDVELEILDVMEEMDEEWVEEWVRRNYVELVHAPSEDGLYDAIRLSELEGREG